MSVFFSLPGRFLPYYQPLDLICLEYDDTGNLYSIWYLKSNRGIHRGEFNQGKCLAKITCGKLSEITKTPVIESFYNQIAGINSKPATFLKRSLHQGGFPVNILEFSALLKKGRIWSPFFCWNGRLCTWNRNFI